MARQRFALTPPTFVVFVISVVLALLAVLLHYTHVAVPMLGPARAFDVLGIAYLVMLAGVLFDGI